MGKKINEVRDLEYPEVVAFLQAQAAIQEFKQEHPEVFEQFEGLVEQYNSTREAAEQVCRAAEVKCGPFDLYQYGTKYDGKQLFDAVGREKFLELGGTIGTKPIYEIDKTRFEAAVAAKKLSKDVVERVRKEEPRYHVPDKLVIP